MTRTLEEACQAARAIGYPLVVKGQSPDVPHKTDAGLVRVGIGDEAQLRSAFETIGRNLRAHDPEAALEGVLIQEMIEAEAVETILGVTSDPVFGPVVVLGIGGVLVELLDDSALALPPLDLTDAMRMIESLKGRRLLEGFRGKPRADVCALADAVVQVANLAADLKDVRLALDLNPLMVRPEGRGVVAADVLMACAPPEATNARVALPPRAQ